MLQDNDNLLTRPKVLNCIVPAGVGSELVDALYHELGLSTANVTRGRGASQRSGTFADEMDILTVVVERERADEVFEFLYYRAEIGKTPHRFIYQSELGIATAFTLPETVEEERD